MLLTSISNIKASPVESTAKNIDTLIKFTFIHSFMIKNAILQRYVLILSTNKS